MPWGVQTVTDPTTAADHYLQFIRHLFQPVSQRVLVELQDAAGLLLQLQLLGRRRKTEHQSSQQVTPSQAQY